MSNWAYDQEFELTAQHLALLKAMYVEWWDAETGAPGIDPKRPYGNSDVALDVADEIDYPYDNEKGLSEDEEAEMLQLHRETQYALQVFIQNAVLEPGKYVCSIHTSLWTPDPRSK